MIGSISAEVAFFSRVESSNTKEVKSSRQRHHEKQLTKIRSVFLFSMGWIVGGREIVQSTKPYAPDEVLLSPRGQRSINICA